MLENPSQETLKRKYFKKKKIKIDSLQNKKDKKQKRKYKEQEEQDLNKLKNKTFMKKL